MADSKDKKTTADKAKTASKVKTTTAKKALATTPNTLTASTLPTADALKDRFKAGSIPLQSDFADLIDMAETGRRAIGGAPDQTGPGAGFKLDENGVLQLKLDSNYKTITNVPVKMYQDTLTISMVSNGGLINKNTSLAVKPGLGIAVSSDGVSVKAGNGITVDSNGVSINFNTVLPKGVIIMFLGTTVPEGWLLCDGNNGTPDLRNRFIMGGDAGDQGGHSTEEFSGAKTAKTMSFSTNSQQVHITGTTAGHSLSAEENGPHSHYNVMAIENLNNSGWGILHGSRDIRNYGYIGANNKGTIQDLSEPRTDADGSGTAHSHDINLTSGAHSHDGTLTVPYYILSFIMKA